MDGTEIPLVVAIVDVQSEKKTVVGKMLGRCTRAAGKAVLVEIDVVNPSSMESTGRITLADFAHVKPMNDAARYLLNDTGQVRV